MSRMDKTAAQPSCGDSTDADAKKPSEPPEVKEIGGPAGPEPTRYGDWERKGIASDF